MRLDGQCTRPYLISLISPTRGSSMHLLAKSVLLMLILSILTITKSHAQDCELNVHTLSDQTLRCRLHKPDRLVKDMGDLSSAVPPKFNFQARLSQAKLLYRGESLPRVGLRISDLSGQLLCGFEKTNLPVQRGVLNIPIQETDFGGCRLAELLAQHNQLKVQVCVGTENCLRPLKLSTVPLALKSEYTYWALRAQYVESASIAHYADRITADRDYLNTAHRALTQNLTGEFVVDRSEIATTSNPSTNAPFVIDDLPSGSTSLLWRPFHSSPAAMHIASKDHQRDQPRRLKRLSWVSAKSTVAGNLGIDGLLVGERRAGLQLLLGDLLIRNPLKISDGLTVSGYEINDSYPLSINEQQEVSEQEISPPQLDPQFSVSLSDTYLGSTRVSTPRLEVSGNTAIEGDLHVGQDIESTQITALGTSTIQGRLETPDLRVDGQNRDLFPALTITAGPSTGSALQASKLTIGPSDDIDSHFVITQGDVKVTDPSVGVVVKGDSVLKRSLHIGSLNDPSSGFATQSLSLQLRSGLAGGGQASRRSRILSSDGEQLWLGEEEKKIIIRGETRIMGDVEFQHPPQRSGGCRIDIPADQRGKPVDEVDRFSLICGEVAVTVRPFRCGNDVVDPGEQCDEGDLRDGDGCSSHCLCEPENLIDGIYFRTTEIDGELKPCSGDLCGNRELDEGEECDDGTAAADGGDDTCENCRERACGNGIRSFDRDGVPEQCDDGNLVNGDGCSSTCRFEDFDGDGILDNDNCPLLRNVDQADHNADGQGNACEPPEDGPLLDSAQVAFGLDEDADDDTRNVAVFLNPRDGDGDLLSYTCPAVNGAPSHGGVTPIAGSPFNFLYTPAPNYNGTDSFTCSVTDGNATAQVTVNVVIDPVPDDPIATYAEVVNLTEDALADDAKGTLTATDPDDNDVGADTAKTFSLRAPIPTGVQFNGAVWSIDLSSYQDLNANDPVTELTVLYRVTDADNASGDGQFTIRITGVNDPPVATFSDTITATEDQAAQTATLTSTDVDDTDAPTYRLDDALGGLSLVGSTITFAPATLYDDLAVDESRTETINYTVTDANGAEGTGQFSVVINGVNDPPSATPQTISADEGSGDKLGTFTATDPDQDAGVGLVYALRAPIPSGFTLTDPSGTWTFDTNHADYNSLAAGDPVIPITVRYKVTDSENSTTNAEITINVSGTNDPPILTAIDPKTVDEDSTLSNQSTSYSDPDTNDTHTFSANAVNGFIIDPDTGVWSFDASHADYQSLAEGEALDPALEITITVNDGTVDESVTFTLNVTGKNDAPTIESISNQTVVEDASLSDQLTVVSDPDTNDTHTFSANAVNGFIIDPDTGVWSFDASHADYQSLAEDEALDPPLGITITVSDGTTTAEQSFSITVTGVNDAPVISAIADETVNVGGSTATDLSTHATDPEGDAMTFSLIGVAPAGCTLNADGVTVDCDASDPAYAAIPSGDSTTVTVNFRVSDAQGATTDGSFNVVISAP